MEQQEYSVFSKEIEQQIARSLQIILNDVVEKNQNEDTKRYYKKKDFCKEMSISFSTLQGWVTKGLPIIQVEGISLIDMRDAEKFLQDHKI
ncbi:hypothetical protein [Desemzia sp. FAM 23991]|uniref:hypothetical protein n=1 Tax=Desemzia sp. FAM 23991 TaxID=3259521 RepID=UPI00388A7937